jgi:hypothetical protein
MRGFPRSVCAIVPLLGLVLGACNGEVEGGGDNPGDEDPGDEDPGDEDPGDEDPVGPDAAVPDAVPSADARTDRFRCSGEPLPTTAPDPISVGGTVSSVGLGGTSPLRNATVQALPVSGGAALATTTSAADGRYTLSLPSGGRPLDVYVRATSGSLLATELYGAAPAVADASSSNFVLASLMIFNFAAGLVDVDQDPALGAATVSVTDCDGNPVQGATVTGFADGVRVYYAAEGKPSTTPTATDVDGLAFVFNAPLGDVNVGATVDGDELRAHRITIRRSTVTLTAIAP